MAAPTVQAIGVALLILHRLDGTRVLRFHTDAGLADIRVPDAELLDLIGRMCTDEAHEWDPEVGDDS